MSGRGQGDGLSLRGLMYERTRLKSRGSVTAGQIDEENEERVNELGEMAPVFGGGGRGGGEE